MLVKLNDFLNKLFNYTIKHLIFYLTTNINFLNLMGNRKFSTIVPFYDCTILILVIIYGSHFKYYYSNNILSLSEDYLYKCSVYVEVKLTNGTRIVLVQSY